MGWATAALAIGSAVAGTDAANRGNRAAQSALDKALAEYNSIENPTEEDLKVLLATPELVGQLTPEAEAAIELGPSALQNIPVDQALRGVQTSALDQMSELAEGGLSEADLAGARQAQRQVDSANMARQKAILSNMEQRGVLGSGAELAARMGANQQATAQQASAQDELIRQSQARALQALSQKGSMASQLRTQDFGESSTKARAADEIARSNMLNQAGVQQRNVAGRNAAQMANLQAKQQIENQRAAIRNQESLQNIEAKQRAFENARKLAGDKAGIYSGKGAAEQRAAAGEAAAIGQVGSSLIKGVSTLDMDGKKG